MGRGPGPNPGARSRTDWLTVSRGAAAVVQWTALALVVALIVIGLAPGSPVRLDLAVERLSGLGGLGGVSPGVEVDPTGRVAVEIAEPSFRLRMLNLGTPVPGLLLVAEIARRMGRLLRSAVDADPFTTEMVDGLNRVAAITALGGIGASVVAGVSRWLLSSHVVVSGSDLSLLRQSPAGWLGAGLIIAGFGQILARGVSMRAELDRVI